MLSSHGLHTTRSSNNTNSKSTSHSLHAQTKQLEDVASVVVNHNRPAQSLEL